MRRLLPAALPPVLALLGLMLVVLAEKAQRVYEACPAGLTHVSIRCGGTAPGPLEPRYLLFGALGGAAAGAWIALVSQRAHLRPALAGLAFCLSVTSVGVHRWADSANQPTMKHATVEPIGTTPQ